jgi:inorganic pyrophosphatase
VSTYKNLPSGDRVPEIVNVVIEIPKGSGHKYEYDPDLDAFCLDRTLYSPMHYPGDYGFIPGTLAEDGDTLDVLILLEQPTFPGCVIRARPIGVLTMIDQGQQDAKVLGVSLGDPRMERIKSFQDVDEHLLREIRYFFDTYSELEGKKTTTQDWLDAAHAKKIITAACERFRRNS